MISFFTDPYPDEILYSAVARYHYRSKNKKTTFTSRDLFDSEAYRVIVDFPSHLDNLIANLPPGHLYTADILINKHTLYPFYVPFLPAERTARIRQCMRSSGQGSRVYPLVGLLTAGIDLNGLRYCPLCAEEDRKSYGEAYWRRVHQIPGVVACAKHKLFLIEGYPHPRYIEERNEHFMTAEQVINLSLIRPLNLDNADHQVHYRIARGAEWLANNELNGIDQSFFNRRYRYVLFNSSLSTFGGTLSLTKIKQKFAAAFPAELLRELGCEVTRTCSWIDRLFNNQRAAQHPVRHLLFTQFCGYSLEDFLKLPAEIKPFGKSPFPCLNPAAPHFRQPVVEKVFITNKQKSDTEISGTFYCDCGFVYKRFGHDENGKKRFQFDRIVQFGEVWDEALRKTFEAGEPDLEETAGKFGVVARTLQRQIARLCLTDKYESLKPKKLGKARTSFAEIEEKRVLYREEWLKIRAENPELSRSKLRWIKEPVHGWLYANDTDWLNQNSPAKETNHSAYYLIDWEKRDAETAIKVAELAGELKRLPGRPVFVSRAVLNRKLKIGHFSKRPHLTPQTIKALEMYSESFEDYALRRIEWGIETCKEENKIPGRDAFMSMMGLSPECLTNHPAIATKLNEALKQIRLI
jgi:hypothetical protein